MYPRSRAQDLRSRLTDAGLDALVCTLPKNILLISGYWPVIGTSLAIAFADGTLHVIVPKDEEDLAHAQGLQNLQAFKPNSLDDLRTAAERVVEPLQRVLSSAKQPALRVGCELGPESEPATYSAVHLYGAAVTNVVRAACPAAETIDATPLLRDMQAQKTDSDISAIRRGCRITARGFHNACRCIVPGMTEVEAASHIRFAFAAALSSFTEVQRAESFFYVMSGANSAEAQGDTRDPERR